MLCIGVPVQETEITALKLEKQIQKQRFALECHGVRLQLRQLTHDFVFFNYIAKVTLD